MNLKIARIKKGWTQEELSKQSGVCRLTISRLESGKQSIESTRVNVLTRLSKALESNIQELFLSDEE